MAAQQGYATFTIAAKDAASGVMGKIGHSMGKLQSAAGTAFKAIAAGAAAAAAAIAGIAIASIKGAIEDEKAQTRLVATLRARGLATQENLAAVDALIASAQNLGITDDQVRASIETATQYTKKFTDALKINKVAQDLAIAKGVDLETATAMVGKAYQGNGKALKQLGIDLTKTTYTTKTKTVVDKAATKAMHDKIDAINEEENRHGKRRIGYDKDIKKEVQLQIAHKGTVKGLEALSRITAQYGGIAEEVANTTAVKFEAAQIALNEKFEAFGYRFLPAVNDALTFFTDSILPAVDTVLAGVGDQMDKFGKTLSEPGGVFDSVGKVAGQLYDKLKPGIDAVGSVLGPLIQSVVDLAGAMWGDGQGPLAQAVLLIGDAFNVLLGIIKPVLDVLKAIIDAITTVVSGMNKLGVKPGLNQGFTPSYGGTQPGGNAQPGGYNAYGTTVVKNTITFGNDAISHIDTSLGRAYSYGGSRTNP